MNLNFCEIEKMTNEELLQVYCLAPQALENKFTGSTWVNVLGCVVNRFVLYYANVKKGYRKNGECIRTT